MKISRLAALPLLMFACSLPGTANDTVRLSRQECVSIALQDNPTIRVADLEVKRMDYSKRETLASVFPNIDFSGAYQRTIKLQTVSMNMGGQTQQFKMGTDNNWNFGFSASMPLVNAQLWKAIQISDTQILSAMEDARASRLDLVNNINKAYYALLLADASRNVIKANYDIAKMNLMGMDHEVTVMPNITLKDMQREMYGYHLGTERDLSQNTSLRTLDIQTKMLKQSLTAKKFAWIPTLGISYNMNWNAMSSGNALKNQQFNPYSNIGIALQVPIFNAVKQAQVQVKEMTFQRENLVNNLNMQVDLALDNLNKQVKQISSSEQGMKQAQKAYDIMQKSFEIGAATYLNLRDAEVANTSAQLSYLQAIYNYLVSTSELDTLLGKEDALGITTYKSAN